MVAHARANCSDQRFRISLNADRLGLDCAWRRASSALIAVREVGLSASSNAACIAGSTASALQVDIGSAFHPVLAGSTADSLTRWKTCQVAHLTNRAENRTAAEVREELSSERAEA